MDTIETEVEPKNTKKRNFSQVSRQSVSPSPPIKMASKDKSMPFEELDPGLDLAKLESISDMDSDTGSLHFKMNTMIGLMRKMMKFLDSHQKIQDLKEENN